MSTRAVCRKHLYGSWTTSKVGEIIGSGDTRRLYVGCCEADWKQDKGERGGRERRRLPGLRRCLQQTQSRWRNFRELTMSTCPYIRKNELVYEYALAKYVLAYARACMCVRVYQYMLALIRPYIDSDAS